MAADQELWQKAHRRAQEKAGFYVHFGIYLAVNAFLAAIWWITTPNGFPWFLFPLAGWGIGVVGHFVAVFAGQGYVERETARQYARMRGGT